MPPFLPILPTHLDSTLLDLSVFGELSLPEGPSELNFQLDVVPAKCPDQFWFGLIEMDRCHENVATGIAIRIDFVKGAVWDAIHGTGFLGNLPAELLAVGSQENEETVLMSLRVEKLGKTLLPNLKIDNETLLYPAISLPETSGHHLTAVAGVSQPGRDAEPFCHFPACWMTQSVQHA